ncbi:hypothetical protein GAY29_27140 [Azospirillum brasilense]|nr:hypothetical protein [Azospirillum brasilense]
MRWERRRSFQGQGQAGPAEQQQAEAKLDLSNRQLARASAPAASTSATINPSLRRTLVFRPFLTGEHATHVQGDGNQHQGGRADDTGEGLVDGHPGHADHLLGLEWYQSFR